MAKKRRKHNKDNQDHLSMDEIEAKMDELREQEGYETLDNDELRIKAIEQLFEEIDEDE